MAYHLSRDYNPESSGYTINKFHISAFYQATLFLYTVLNYSIVGQTNWNISASPFIVAQGLTSNNQGAGINFGDSAKYEVSIPISIRTVSLSDIGRILVLKSSNNPTKNSGLFKILNINSTDNRLIIDYRSNDTPPAEVNTMDWWIYEKETSLSSSFNNDGYNILGYAGGNASNSKIILQSPHASGWQVRFCVEPITFNSVLPNISIAVGYDGNSNGDFLINGNHSHISQFLNSNPSGGYINSVPGFGHANAIDRLTMAGDDTGQSFFAFTRSISNGEIISFGIPDNENQSPSSDASRLFCYAKAPVGTNADNDSIALRLGQNLNVGTSYKDGAPLLCGFATYCSIDGYNNSLLSSNASDCPFTNSTEILPVEIWAGITADITLSKTQALNTIYSINPMFMGTVPFIRIGRANFGNFTTTSDVNKSWLHIKNGIYLQYSGPTPI